MISLKQKVNQTIREIPNFPKEGIVFKDITPILQNPTLCSEIVDFFYQSFKNQKIDAVIGVESRGFLFGMMLANKLNVPFVTVRKKGKLPYHTISYKYDLEYGSAEVEMHIDALKPNDNVIIHDDLLATGGTAAAAAELTQMNKANVVGFAFLIELSALKGVDKLKNYSSNIVNLISY
jgi:adenine phosphoribosyltransferase